MLSKKILIILPLILLNLCISAQVQNILPLGIAPAGADVVYTQKWLAWANPSMLARTKNIEITLGYENRYFIPELSDEYLYVSIPTKYFNIGCSYKFFGYAEYNEMMAALTVARKINIVSIGLEFDYFNMHVSQETGYEHAFTAQIGLQVDVSKNCVFGFRMFNPCFSQIKINNNFRKLPIIMQLGCNYTFIKDLDILVQVGYILNHGFDWAVGFEYRIMPQLLVRLGARGSDYVIPNLGVGVRFGGFGFDLTAEEDFRIGMLLMGNLHYRF